MSSAEAGATKPQISLGIKIPPTNLKPNFRHEALAFANKLADSLLGSRNQNRMSEESVT